MSTVHKTRPKRLVVLNTATNHQPGNLSIAQMKLERHGSEMQMLPFFHINIDPETSILLAESHLLTLFFFFKEGF